MFRKALRKLAKVTSKEEEAPAPKSKAVKPPAAPKPDQRKILTAAGWKKLMMKKYRKTS
jgi:hypothetical protein